MVKDGRASKIIPSSCVCLFFFLLGGGVVQSQPMAHGTYQVVLFLEATLRVSNSKIPGPRLKSKS